MGEPNAHRFLFYAPLLGESSSVIDLEGEEFHHLSRVLRMSPGEVAYATNGRGVLARCRVDHLSRRTARLAVLDAEAVAPGPRVWLALALLRKEAFERAVEQCTELGISGCLPFVSERSHVRRYSSEFMVRLRRIALSAMKQSYRTYLPDVEDVTGFDDLAVRLRASTRIFLGDSDGAAPAAVLGGSGGAGGEPGPTEAPLWIVIGPEGGLSADERARLNEAGVRPVRISRNRLRSETAAAVLAAFALSAGDGNRTVSAD